VRDYTSIIDDFYSRPVKHGLDGSDHFISRSSLQRDEVETLFDIVSTYKPVKTLEVGLALAASCMAIIAAKQRAGVFQRHVPLDPFQEKFTKNAGLLELEKLSLTEGIDFRAEFSETFLTNAFTTGDKFDFIFIDGSHTIGQAVTDVFLADKVLNPGGIIAIHDSILFSTAASVKYLINERGYQLVLSKRYNYKVIGRMIKHVSKVGWWYAQNVIPRIQSSLVALKKMD
jgi:predicted O-methyltransferase YrrM